MSRSSGKLQILGLYRQGRFLEEYELKLSTQPRGWGVLYLQPYAGQELELWLEGGDEALLDLLELSDRFRDNKKHWLFSKRKRFFVYYAWTFAITACIIS